MTAITQASSLLVCNAILQQIEGAGACHTSTSWDYWDPPWCQATVQGRSNQMMHPLCSCCGTAWMHTKGSHRTLSVYHALGVRRGWVCMVQSKSMLQCLLDYDVASIIATDSTASARHEQVPSPEHEGLEPVHWCPVLWTSHNGNIALVKASIDGSCRTGEDAARSPSKQRTHDGCLALCASACT
jgi:hypothetical protein